MAIKTVFVDPDENFSHPEHALKNMRIAIQQLRVLFPEKEWSYHQNHYKQTLQNPNN
ncbi:hypothetical protein AAEO56_01150 [Flavobacterium sp. DGU11]|uniref:Uncharacterized protein n=1 Tax=Flavobacterium arundinis TaxID=3139143 RepID=A0ABU9HRS0_9FLAO